LAEFFSQPSAAASSLCPADPSCRELEDFDEASGGRGQIGILSIGDGDRAQLGDFDQYFMTGARI
jgi:hypothetical protein